MAFETVQSILNRLYEMTPSGYDAKLRSEADAKIALTRAFGESVKKTADHIRQDGHTETANDILSLGSMLLLEEEIDLKAISDKSFKNAASKVGMSEERSNVAKCAIQGVSHNLSV